MLEVSTDQQLFMNLISSHVVQHHEENDLSMFSNFKTKIKLLDIIINKQNQNENKDETNGLKITFKFKVSRQCPTSGTKKRS